MLRFKYYIMENKKPIGKTNREIQLAHDDAMRSLLTSKGFTERTDKPAPHQLKPDEFAVYEPGHSEARKSDTKSDIFLNFEGAVLGGENKAKSDTSIKGASTGVHQNDYTVSSDVPFQIYTPANRTPRFRTARQLAQTARASREPFVQKLVQRFTDATTTVLGSISRSGKVRAFPAPGSENRQDVIEKTGKMIPTFLGQLGSHFTISGSSRGVAAIPHLPKDHELRPKIDRLFARLGMAKTHEPEDISTAGSPVWLPPDEPVGDKPGRGSRAVIRTNVPISDKNREAFKSNAGILYPPTTPIK